MDAHEETALGVYQIDEQIAARQVVRVLIEVLGPEDKEIVARLAEANGIISEAWQPESDGVFRTFERRVARIRRVVKKVAAL